MTPALQLSMLESDISELHGQPQTPPITSHLCATSSFDQPLASAFSSASSQGAMLGFVPKISLRKYAYTSTHLHPYTSTQLHNCTPTPLRIDLCACMPESIQAYMGTCITTYMHKLTRHLVEFLERFLSSDANTRSCVARRMHTLACSQASIMSEQGHGQWSSLHLRVYSNIFTQSFMTTCIRIHTYTYECTQILHNAHTHAHLDLCAKGELVCR